VNLKLVKIWLCEACLNGDGDECHTPGCALCWHNSPGHSIEPKLYEILNEYDMSKGCNPLLN